MFFFSHADFDAVKKKTENNVRNSEAINMENESSFA